MTSILGRDIYSLGVLLYELLTGTTPIEAARLREAGYGEIQRLIRDVEPPRPSTRLSSLGDSATVVAGNRATDPKHLCRLLAGDLDWIVMKALEKDRNRRYAIAGEVLPTTWSVTYGGRRSWRGRRQQSIGWRSSHTPSRGRAGRGGGDGGTAHGTTIATWQAIVATRAKHEALAAATAERQAKQVAVAKEAETQAVLRFVQNQILAAARPKGRNGGLGPGVTLREAIDAAVPFVEKSFKDQPLTEARLRMTLGDSFWYLGDGKAAEAQYEPARAIFTRLLGPDHPDTLECCHPARDQLWDARAHPRKRQSLRRDSTDLQSQVRPGRSGNASEHEQPRHGLIRHWINTKRPFAFTRKFLQSRKSNMVPTIAARSSP